MTLEIIKIGFFKNRENGLNDYYPKKQENRPYFCEKKPK